MSNGNLKIDLDAIANNWRALDSSSAANVETGATVKANAYSLGIERVSEALCQAGCRTFFVASAREGIALRQSIGEGPRIFVYGGHMSGETNVIESRNLIPLLNSIEQITRHIETLPLRPFGIQLDSGMNRLGLEPAEWEACRNLVLPMRPKLVMSHLACADEPGHEMNTKQLETFRDMVEGVDTPLSLSATAGILLGEDYHFNVTRPGIGLYGGLPFENAETVVTLSAPVTQVRDLAPGETVGYANAWTAERPTRVATLATGYADGIHRSGGKPLNVFAMGQPCPVIGRISMDMITVDVTDIADIPDFFGIICPQQNIDQLADVLGTIGHEVLTSMGGRYHRIYKTSA